MDIISREDAIGRGLNLYFTGKPCKRGHYSTRRVSTWACVECSRELNKIYDAARYTADPEYFSQKNKQWMDGHKEERGAYMRTRRDKHKINVCKNDGDKLPDSRSIVSRNEAIVLGLTHYCTGLPCKNGHIALRMVSNGVCVVCNYGRIKMDRDTKPEKHLFYKSKRRCAEAFPTWIDDEERQQIETIYGESVELSQTGIQYDVDHRVPLQGKMVSGLHVPENLAIIRHTENVIKGNTFNQENESRNYLNWMKERGL